MPTQTAPEASHTYPPLHLQTWSATEAPHRNPPGPSPPRRCDVDDHSGRTGCNDAREGQREDGGKCEQGVPCTAHRYTPGSTCLTNSPAQLRQMMSSCAACDSEQGPHVTLSPVARPIIGFVDVTRCGSSKIPHNPIQAPSRLHSSPLHSMVLLSYHILSVAFRSLAVSLSFRSFLVPAWMLR